MDISIKSTSLAGAFFIVAPHKSKGDAKKKYVKKKFKSDLKTPPV